ncbi:hypothetical protein LSCM1_04418 [Leishmania martiniquensis]|uniref:Splicing factor YJU2 n=1 Tax=Leishmania martiniquensis TaxID=1580590 RepID=A0A836HBR6_9TRYP|nr:hypothetical protein LSCM1_04418 [Leishmania martiniquensis]
MSKINATYSSGYYIAPDVDFRKLEEQQRGKRKHGGVGDAGSDNVKRQTFAIPFDLICDHCDRRIARGSHVYANRRATEKRYLGSIRVWQLEISCRFCKGKYCLLTDPETPKDTGGYICEKGCRRVEGDFYSLNKQNAAAREEWENEKAEAELNPLAAMERENEAARELEERNRQIEEAVEERAEHDDTDLLTMLRSRPRRAEARAVALDSGSDEDAEGNGHADVALSSTGAEGAPPPVSSSASFSLPKPSTVGDNSDDDGGGGDEEDADERAFRAFNEDMERRWRSLERQHRARQRQQEQQVNFPENTMPADEDELKRVLARYGGVRRVPAETVTTAPIEEQEPSALQAQGPAVSVAPSTTLPPTAAPKSNDIQQNKFFVHSDEDHGDWDDADAEEPLLARLRGRQLSQPVFASAPRATKGVSAATGGTPSMRATPRFATLASVSPTNPPPQRDGRSVLCRLVDDEDDEGERS